MMAAAIEQPRAAAVIDGPRAVTFSELAGRVRSRLAALDAALQHDSGWPRAPLVSLAVDDGLSSIEWVLACIERELPFLPLHARLGAAERSLLIDAARPSLHVDAASGEVASSAAQAPGAGRWPLSLPPVLAAIATSGSTGAPRLALLGRHAFLASADASAKNLGWYTDDRWLSCLPLAHIGGLSVVTRCLIARRPIVLVPRGPGSSAERLARALVEGEATLASLVPTQLSALLSLEPAFALPPRVRGLLTGGAATSPSLLEAAARRNWPVLTSYGLTEACSQVTTVPPGTIHRGELGCGKPLPGVRLRLDAGVIEIAGPTLFSGYMDEPRSGLGADGWYRTRDLGRFDELGNLHVLGRIDDVIISGGENVSPGEVEAVLERCPGVLEACVFGVPDPHWGQLVAAALRVADPDDTALIAAVEGAARERLAPFKRPRAYALTQSFETGSTGKRDRRATARSLGPALKPAPSPASGTAPPRAQG